jgi:hypothetical protein
MKLKEKTMLAAPNRAPKPPTILKRVAIDMTQLLRWFRCESDVY